MFDKNCNFASYLNYKINFDKYQLKCNYAKK